MITRIRFAIVMAIVLALRQPCCGQEAAVATTEPASCPATQPGAKPKITVGKETTYLLGPLRADGSVDYVAAYDREIGAGVKTDENAYVLIVQVTGPQSIPANQGPALFKRLGIDPLPAKGSYFVSFPDYLKTQPPGKQSPGDLDEAVKGPWKEADFPAVAAWLKANDRPLALLAEAVRRPKYYLPAMIEGNSGLLSLLLPDLQPSIRLGAALTARAMLKISCGESEAAWQDALILYRLSRLMGQPPHVMSQLVGGTLENWANRVLTQILLVKSNLPKAEARRMLAELHALPPWQPDALARAMRGERLMCLDALSHAMRSSDAVGEITGTKSSTNLHYDAGNVLRIMNGWYDRICETVEQPDYPTRIKAVKALAADYEKLCMEVEENNNAPLVAFLLGRTDSNKAVANLALAIFFPATKRILAEETSVEERTEMSQIALALAAFKDEKGAFPQKLAELAPGYLPKVPNDLFIGQPLKYSRTANGYLLYSVGPNMKDDGGKNDRKSFPPLDDIVVEIKAQPAAPASQSADTHN